MRFACGDVRDHIVLQKERPPIFVSTLQRVSAVATSKDQLSRDFRCCSIFDFCNSIGAKRTFGRKLRGINPPAAGLATARATAGIST
jgi:hypothetical protein